MVSDSAASSERPCRAARRFKRAVRSSNERSGRRPNCAHVDFRPSGLLDEIIDLNGLE